MKTQNTTKGEQVAKAIFEVLAYIPVIAFGYWAINITIKYL